MKSVRIIIIDSDETTRKAIRAKLSALSGAEIIGEASTPAGGQRILRHERPEILVVEVEGVDDAGMSLVSMVREEMPETAILITSQHKNPDLIMKAMQAGAREFLLRPVEYPVLVAAAQKIIAEFARRGAELQTKGRVLTFFSNKGGVGTTTLATNAAAGLARLSGQEVALVDLDLQLGNVVSFLDLAPKYTLHDLVLKIDQVTPLSVKSFLSKHESGVAVLAEPRTPAEAEAITTEHVTKIIGLLRTAYPFIVIDTPHIFDERTLEVLDTSDEIYITTELSLPALRNLKKCLDVFRNLQYDTQDIRVVVNRYDPKGGIDLKDVEKKIGFEPFWKVPNDFGRIMEGINHGRPVVTNEKGGEVGKSLNHFCEKLLGSTDGDQPEKKEKKKGGFFRGFRGKK